MKQITKIAIIILIGSLLSGCIESPSEVPTNNPIPEEIVYEVTYIVTVDPSTIPTPQDEIYTTEIGKSIKNNQMDVYVKSQEIISEYEFMGYKNIKTVYPEFGNEFIIFDCLIENVGSNTIYSGGIYFTMGVDKYHYDPIGFLYEDDVVQKLKWSQELHPGQIMTGKIAFEIPSNSTSAKLYYDFGGMFETNFAAWDIAIP